MVGQHCGHHCDRYESFGTLTRHPPITSTTRPLVPPSANRARNTHQPDSERRCGTIFPPTRHQTRSQRHRVSRLPHRRRRTTPSVGLHGASSLRWMPCLQEKQGHVYRDVLYIQLPIADPHVAITTCHFRERPPGSEARAPLCIVALRPPLISSRPANHPHFSTILIPPTRRRNTCGFSGYIFFLMFIRLLYDI